MTTSDVSKNLTGDLNNTSSDDEDQGIGNGQSAASTANTPHERGQPKSNKKVSTRGRNRSDLPTMYCTSDNRFNNRFLPEVQYLYGLEQDPWSRLSVVLAQRARDKVFTEFQDTLTAKSPVFRNVCDKP